MGSFLLVVHLANIDILFYICLTRISLFADKWYITLRKNMFLKYINRQLWGKMWGKIR